jgi:hypothetical protein
MPLGCDFDDITEPRRARILALRRLWRSMERLAASVTAEQGDVMAVSRPELTRDLQELIAALDRRLPGVEQAGEVGIARDAAALRARAVARLAELTNESALLTEPLATRR